MADIQDINESDDVSEIEAVAEIDKATESAGSDEGQKTQEEILEELPERYRGKSVKEIIEIAEADKKSMGRYANEAGELRRLADELIKSQLKPKEQKDEPPEVDFFENPQEAIRRAVESNPRVLQAEQYAIQAQRTQATQQLAQLHPDFAQVVQDADFTKWIGESKKRVQMFKEAEAYDVDSAHELLSTFKQLKAVKQQAMQSVVSDAEKTARTKTMQAAAVDTGGSGETPRKVYRRADLIRLQMTDPARYESMNDEILLAYSQGRVK